MCFHFEVQEFSLLFERGSDQDCYEGKTYNCLDQGCPSQSKKEENLEERRLGCDFVKKFWIETCRAMNSRLEGCSLLRS